MATFVEVAAHAGNALDYEEGRLFAAIVGASPSRGARSPALWNAAFAAHDIDALMLSIDVLPENVRALLYALDANPCFLGGAVAMPYKETVARWLGDRVSVEARTIGSVNCLFRGADGRIAGTNTDGEGALASFLSHFGSPLGTSVAVLGAGGAGKAVATFFGRAVGRNGRLAVCSRSRSGESLAAALDAEWLGWADLDLAVDGADVVVNCTSVGAGDQEGSSPLSSEQLDRLAASTRIFDIIYRPSPTVLLSLARARGLATLDGGPMNLEQAVLAYGHAAKSPRGETTTRAAMAAAKQKLD
jgi:shikimate dehydrogenase